MGVGAGIEFKVADELEVPIDGTLDPVIEHIKETIEPKWLQKWLAANI